MDIDCDGLQSAGGCHSADTQGQTRWVSEVRDYSAIADPSHPVKDLDANKIPYVVFGNECDGKCPSGYAPFDPRNYGIKPLSVMAVICNGQLVRRAQRLCSTTIN